MADGTASVSALEILAIIPARAGSKGIPGKNLCRVAGRSLVGWSVHAALTSRYRLRVVVSTDGEEIAAEARRCGAEVVMRPAELSGDTASSESALLHVLEALEKRDGYQPAWIVFLQCTSPLTAAEDIDGTIDAVLQQNGDSGLAVVPFHYFLWRPDASGDWIGINHDRRVRLRRQDREPEFLETGAIYVMRAEGFRRAKHRYFGKTVAYSMPAERRLEIDDAEDLVHAEFMLSRAQHESGSVAGRPLAGVKAVVFDFDGVMTDDCVTVSQDGTESVRCCRSDGYGIDLLREAGVPMLILSKEQNPVVSARAAKLKIPVRQGIHPKRQALQAWCTEQGVALADVAYVGNDLNDLECLRLVGHPVAPADAHPAVRAVSRVVLTRSGGHGVVRECAELILISNGRDFVSQDTP